MSRHGRSPGVRAAVVIALLAALLGLPALLGGVARASAGSAAQQPDRVWVNTGSGVYHCPGSQYYGNTKRGAYMTETAARAEGHRPAYGRACSSVARAVAESIPVLSTARTPAVRVWVNTTSGVYHCPGSRYYEATKRGRLMTEKAARDAGYRAAYGRACS